MNRRVFIVLAVAAGVLPALPPSAHAMNDPATGRWLSRDPLGSNRAVVNPRVSHRAIGHASQTVPGLATQSLAPEEWHLVIALYRGQIAFSTDASGLCDAPGSVSCDLSGSHGPGPHYTQSSGGDEHPCVCPCLWVHEETHMQQLYDACRVAQAAYAACGDSRICREQLQNRWNNWDQHVCNRAHAECEAYNNQISCLTNRALLGPCACKCTAELSKPIGPGPQPPDIVGWMAHFCALADGCGPPQPFVP